MRPRGTKSEPAFALALLVAAASACSSDGSSTILMPADDGQVA